MSLSSLMKRLPFAHIYDGTRLAPIVRRSLTFMLIGNIFGNLHAIICGAGTTSMIGLANTLNAGDLTFGILNGIPQAAALFQIPFSMLVNRTHKRKRYLMTYGVFSRAIWLLFGFIPLIVPLASESLALWTIIFLLGISSVCSSMINVCWFPWFAELAPLQMRGRWISMRDTAVSLCNLFFGLLVAFMLDNLPAESKYMIVFVLGGILGIMDMLCFSKCQEVYSTPPKQLKLKAVFANVLANKPFVWFTLMWTAWCFTANMSGMYLNRYVINEMGISYTQLMVFGTMAASVSTILVMPRWGRLMDKFGCRSVMLIACVMGSLTPAFFLLSTPGNVVPILLHNLIGAAFWSASNLAANSMQLSCSPDDLRPSYIAIFSCVASLVGTALGTIVGGVMLETMSTFNITFLGLDRYKILILISVLLRLACVLLLVPRTSNDNDGTVSGLLHALIPCKGMSLFLFRKEK